MNRAAAGKSGETGFTLIEIILSSVIGLIAITGILYQFKGQHRNMVNQSGLSGIRMNGQYTVNEIGYYLNHVAMGLPKNLNGLLMEDGELVIKLNPTRKSAAAVKSAMSNGARTIYDIPIADAALFDAVGRAVALMGSLPVEAEIISVAPAPGKPALAQVALDGNEADFPLRTELFPEARVKIHVCSGIGADTSAGDFRLLYETPRKRAGIRPDSLTFAEGVESVRYSFIKTDRDSVSALPTDLDSLLSIRVQVVTRTRIPDPHLPGDGIQRQAFSSSVNYRRSL